MAIVRPVADLVFMFGPFKLIPSQHLLVRDNHTVTLGGRALDILHLLLMRAGEEVSASALIAFTWPDVFVDRSNLKVHISNLRRALEDTLPESTYITTVVGHGYQFVGRVQTRRAANADVAGDDLRAAGSQGVAAMSDVFTIARVAAMLGEDQDWLLAVALEMDPQAGCVTIYDVDDRGTISFTGFGIDNLKKRLEIHKEDSPILERDRKLG